MSSKKRTLDNFFRAASPAKKQKVSNTETSQTSEDENSLISSSEPPSFHGTYPFPVPQFSTSIVEGLGFSPASDPRVINDQPDLDLLYYSPYIASHVHKQLFEFLRSELFFYRVKYKIKRGSVEVDINTPRYTTVFGIDETSFFATADGSLATSGLPVNTSSGDLEIFDKATKKPVSKTKYKYSPRPLPHCLDMLRQITEGTTGESFNFCLVNYYSSGNDSISYHSDDERFLGNDPAIASFSLGGNRDFLMRHKPLPSNASHEPEQINAETAEYRKAVETAASKPIKLPLASGDMILMRGRTQSRWLHSIPKRKGPEANSGRINITFRKALVPGGTENYYNYNVGTGPPYKWDPNAREMVLWNVKDTR